MLKDSRTGDVGFVIPKLIAIDYRNLLMETLPRMEEKTIMLERDLEKHKSIINGQKEMIDALKLNVDDSKKQFNVEHSIRLACEKEVKKARCWRYGTYALGIVLAGVLIFN